MNIHVIPAIIPQDFDDLESHLARLAQDEVAEALGRPVWVQIDIMDGAFAPTKSWPFSGGTREFEAILDEERGLPFWEQFNFEIDMMVAYPEHHVEDWIRAGAAALIVHAASTEKFEEIRKVCDEFNTSLGVAFRPSDELDMNLVEMSDFVQLMGNDRIGYHGVNLDMKIYADAVKIRREFPDLDIAVDIGVDAETAPRLIDAGVNKLVSGSYIFDSMDIPSAIHNLKGE